VKDNKNKRKPQQIKSQNQKNLVE